MILHFKKKFPQLTPYWDKYLEFQKRVEVPAKTILLKEGKTSTHYYFIEKGCIRAALNKDGKDKTVQFFFENEGMSSIESFLKNIPSLVTVETIEPSVIYQLPKVHVTKLMDELSREPESLKIILEISVERQLHYMHEFISFIRDTPEQRYKNLLKKNPHIIQRVPQHYIASYLGVSTVHLSRIKSKIAKGKAHF
jgi:CRP-like cAMP-binding protein